MLSQKITKVDFLDIIFAGRNKTYGAYDLRKTYNRRILLALVITFLLIALVLTGSAIFTRLLKTDIGPVITVRDISLAQLKPEEPAPPPPPPPKLPPPAPLLRVATIAFTPPKIVKDEEVIKPPPEIKQIDQARIDVKTVAGTQDIGIIAPPSEDKGTQVAAAPFQKKEEEDKIFTKVEIDAAFPGGPEGWSKYVEKAIEVNVDEFTEADFGTCIVKFIVDKTGKVSGVEATNMRGSKLAETATNIIRKGPNWIPAQQNGKYVNAYRLQPITFKGPDQ
jgi:protein TonB